MHELDRGGRSDVPIAGVAAHLGGCESQHRPETLSTRCDQVVSQLRDEFDIRNGFIQNDAIDRFHVLFNELEQRLEALGRRAAFFEWDDNTHGHDLSNDPVCYTGASPAYSPARCGTRRHGPKEEKSMRELMRVNDPVLISYVDALLRGAGFAPVFLDRNMSVLEGSIGILPCRVLIDEQDWEAARRLITNADLGHWVIEEFGS
jgi:hypothetical protein